jgi:hypothetical protein
VDSTFVGRSPYRDRVERQGLEWIDGNSLHNQQDDECCPDFSCCFPECYEQDRLKRIESHNRWAKRYGYNSFTDD